MTETLNILIGDDEFKDAFTEIIFKRNYIPKLQNQVQNYQLNWRCETEPQTVINEARTGKYKIVVTDLDYTGGGRGKEGYKVVDEVSKISPKPIIILCSSCDNHEEIEKRTNGKIEFRAGGTGKGHKFDDLVEILAKHFTK